MSEGRGEVQPRGARSESEISTRAGSIADVVADASSAIFGKPLVTNIYRSIIVEAIVHRALPEWAWCSADYAPFDFQHPDGTRLEVKQSAAKQTWPTNRRSAISWDIAPRKGYFIGADWTERPGRNADIYILAEHPVYDETADHREPAQWRFFVIIAGRLPDMKRLSRTAAASLADPVDFNRLHAAVEEVRRSC